MVELQNATAFDDYSGTLQSAAIETSVCKKFTFERNMLP
jgi:hypothetical protein